MSIINNPTSLNIRYITIVLTLDPNSTPNTFANGSNTKVITANSQQNNLAVTCSINKINGLQQCSADVTIEGMQYQDCIAFSYYNSNTLFQYSKNTIKIYAGYTLGADGYPPLVYGAGQIMWATPDFNNPDRSFIIKSVMALFYQNAATTTFSAKGLVALDSLFSQLAKNIDSSLNYQSLGVTGYATNPVYEGSAWEQLKIACAHYGYQAQLDNNIIKISKTSHAYSANTVILNKDTGMLGYPILTPFGCSVRCRFNPNIQFGDTVQLTSYLTTVNNDVTTANETNNKQWFINGLVHTLENQGSKWESVLSLNKYPFQIAT